MRLTLFLQQEAKRAHKQEAAEQQRLGKEAAKRAAKEPIKLRKDEKIRHDERRSKWL